jgi:hypothetical protein
MILRESQRISDMPSKSITHNFKYTKKDIENLIKGDIARQLGMKTIPIISYSIVFEFGEDYDTNECGVNTTLEGVEAKVEVPG